MEGSSECQKTVVEELRSKKEKAEKQTQTRAEIKIIEFEASEEDEYVVENEHRS